MEAGEVTEPEADRTGRAAWRIARIGVFALLAILAIGALVVWLTRERIADNIIADQMQQYDLPGTYEIESIGPARQVVRNVVIGDPQRPDLTIERLVINLRYRFGLPAIGRIEVIRPRLNGAVSEQGRLTFGALDNVLYADSGEPPGLPDLDIRLVDGRARVETPLGAIGIKAEGEGELDDGFAGTLAAVAPSMAGGGCTLENVTLYGEVTVEGGRPAIAGPLRMGAAGCPDRGLSLAGADFSLGLTGDAALDGADARLVGTAGRFAFAGGAARSTSLGTQIGLRGGRVVARFDATLESAVADGTGFSSLSLVGGFRSDSGFRAYQSDIAVEGEGLSLNPMVVGGLRDSAATAQGTLLAPLLAKLAAAVDREVNGATLVADAMLRSGEEGLTIVAPRASLRSSEGNALATLTRVQLRLDGAGVPQVSGNLAMGGGGLPQLQGRMERDGNGASLFRLRMAPYEAQDSRLAFSQLELRQSVSGALTLAGTVEADGPLPGGEVRGLSVPLEGRVAANGALTMWSSCTPVTFRRLAVYQLALDARRLTLCPQRGQPILRYDARGLAVAAGAAGLDLAGAIGDSPVRLVSGPVGIAWPGALTVEDVDLAIGEQGSMARFMIPELRGTLGQSLSGSFAGAEIGLDAVPLDIRDASGNWRFADSILTIEHGLLRVEDRRDEDLFNPLFARDASLVLADGRITARADLREAASDRIVTGVEINHDLASATGSADLAVAGLRFDKGLQPVTLTELARGLVALVDGTVRGTGRVDWNPQQVTSTGRFTTDGLDFAAPFGPVKGASGTVVFTDLLGLTTAPEQTLSVQSLNPGIEVDDGVITYQLTGGTLLDLKRGSWPWLGGTLTMRPVQLDFSRPETRAYVFDVSGLDAALFIQRLELSNIAATGTFDGTLSVVFDEFGNGFIQDSVLVSRPPGGNVSYVGELTYEDMGAIANFAFQSLRSLDFRQMTVGVEGPLAGDVLTAITFEGVSQGEGAETNFITRRLGRLPIRFNVNVRAPFYQLLNNMRSLYDPDFVPDPRSIPGLIAPPEAPTGTQQLAPEKPPIQDPESEDKP